MVLEAEGSGWVAGVKKGNDVPDDCMCTSMRDRSASNLEGKPTQNNDSERAQQITMLACSASWTRMGSWV